MIWDTQVFSHTFWNSIHTFENFNGKNHYYEKNSKIQQIQMKLPRSTNVSLLQDAQWKDKGPTSWEEFKQQLNSRLQTSLGDVTKLPYYIPQSWYNNGA